MTLGNVHQVMGNSATDMGNSASVIGNLAPKLGNAMFSPCRTHRYVLYRDWLAGRDLRRLMVIGLNPSTADEFANDPTVTRCCNFAKGWGFSGLVMTNLFSYRATDPACIKAAAHPTDTENDRWLLQEAAAAGLVIAAWGVHGSHLDRAAQLTSMLRNAGIELHCLGTTKAGDPRHPLYMPRDCQPVVWTDGLTQEACEKLAADGPRAATYQANEERHLKNDHDLRQVWKPTDEVRNKHTRSHKHGAFTSTREHSR
jgi:hypothetical protein